jgi:predicted CoA-binding protein
LYVEEHGIAEHPGGHILMTKATDGASVAVLGASPKPDRYSFKAVRMLREHGFKPIPIHPAGHAVDGIPGLPSLDDLGEAPDTLTVYVNAKVSDAERERILRLRPRRVVFNPGANNHPLAEILERHGIQVVHACTLVMLRTGQF